MKPKDGFVVTSQNLSLDVFLKPNIAYEVNYEIILPQLHQLLVDSSNSRAFNIDLESYVPILRKYKRLHGKLALKTMLEVHFNLVRLEIE